MRALSIGLVTWVALSAGQASAAAQESSGSWAVDAAVRHYTVPDVTYLVAEGHESKLDLILPRGADEAVPTLIYFHGGGWVGGSKEGVDLLLLPYLEMGWAVVNVGYRLGSVSLAPGAVEDCRCALRWVRNNAERYKIDPDRIVVTGHSAGGHLSLTTALLEERAGFDRRCPQRATEGGRADATVEEMSVAAVVNWFGITDVWDLVVGPNAKTYAVAWMGGVENRESLARRLSPLSWVREGLPPVLTVHGDADPIVPYQHAVRLHRALDDKSVPNRLHTVAGGGHGGFTVEETRAAWAVIRDFLAEHVAAGHVGPH